MAWGSNKLHFTYDSIGPASVTYNGNRYFDVTGLVNASGTMAATLGAANPLRYRGYVYDLSLIHIFYPWERFQMVGLYPISKVSEETPGEAFMMVCSTVMLEGTAGGRINIERATFRWPQVLIFPSLTGEERMQFESLRRGEIPPDLEDQEPDEEE